jgi:phosphoribosylformylglycinamidine synthase
VGAIDDEQIVKGEGEPGMIAVKLGGPAYRIGMGGSAASSMMQGENRADLDFNAVQRGDAEMEQKVNRVIRACCELGEANPIISIHDQGAGGNCNVLKEIISPAGGRIDVRKILVGDSSLSVMEIWGAEYQESDALLIRPDSVPLFTALCARERVSVAYVGEVTGDGYIRLEDSSDGTTPVCLPLEKVLGKMPQKTFVDTRAAPASAPAVLPADATVASALDRVLRLVSVGSKRFLTNKVDRSVTGLVAQQQCVGPLHTPLADVAVIASSFFDNVGVASSIGEQPIKGLANPAAMARLAVAEAVTNMVSARVTALNEAKCSANWMWAAKLPHEGAALLDAACAMADFMVAVGVAVDGGKDSLSMAAKTPDGKVVKAPGTLVISLYAPCPDVNNVRTPDFKTPGSSSVVHVRPIPADAAAKGSLTHRIGGSALLQVYGSVGAKDEIPDCEHPELLVAAFAATQALLDEAGTVLSVHDVSDGGAVVSALEMAFAGNCGVSLRFPAAGSASGAANPLAPLFAEEVGILLEVPTAKVASVLAAYEAKGVYASVIGETAAAQSVSVEVGGASVLSAAMPALRDAWEATSFQLERLQCNPVCVEQEEAGMAGRRAPPYALTFSCTTPVPLPAASAKHPRVAILREEGSNGDREMSAAFFAAGFEVCDVTMSDLVSGRATIDASFRGLVFPGGFSYADVLDSAKGWAGTIRYNKNVMDQLSAFFARKDTFSLGVCNGCQLMALLGYVPNGAGALADTEQPRFIHNASGRYESRFTAVRINDSPSIMFKGMAGSVLGVWVAHGEGRAHFPDPAVRAAVESGRMVPLTYVDDDGAATEVYPFNPNGSPGGIAGLCTADGRHMAIMPHPERGHKLWQWPWMPQAWADQVRESPWQRMFHNAYDWCLATEAAGGK